MAPPSAKAITIQEFHRMVPTEQAQDKLPEGPSAESATTHSRKWVAEWGDDIAVEVAAPGSLCTPAVGSIDDFKTALDLCLNEYLGNFDVAEAVRCISELQAPQFHHQVIKRGVLRAMDRAARERELVAVLFSSLHARGVLNPEQIEAGFRSLVESLDDICIDTPAACPLLAHFLADAVLDGLLSRAAMEAWPAEVTQSPLVSRMLSEAEVRMHGRQPVGDARAEGRRLREALRRVVDEYLSSHDADEVRRRLAELAVPSEAQHELVRTAVELALDRRDVERELVCQLLSSLLGAPLLQLQLVRGFEMLLERIDDLTIDNPSAPSLLAAFLVRATSDDLLSPAFVRQPPPEALLSEHQQSTLSQARALLAASHFGDRRRNVFGRSTRASIETLKQDVTDMVREYFSSGSIDEAVRCVRELDAPAFHHEVVKRLLVLGLDRAEREQKLAHDLTVRLCKEDMLSAEQLGHGCERTVDAEPDLRLDNPRAGAVLATFIEQCCADELLPEPDTWIQVAERLRATG